MTKKALATVAATFTLHPSGQVAVAAAARGLVKCALTVTGHPSGLVTVAATVTKASFVTTWSQNGPFALKCGADASKFDAESHGGHENAWKLLEIHCCVW